MTEVPPTDTRASLIIRLRDQQDLAWREFFQIYTPMVLSYALRRGVQSNDAEDITQEVMLEVTRCIRNFEYDPAKGRFRDWLGLITRRRLGRYWQAQKRHQATALDGHDDGKIDGDGCLDAEWIDAFQARILEVALKNIQSLFADVTWHAFQAVWHEGLSATEASGRLNIPIEVVYNAKSRVLKKLKAEVLRIADENFWLPTG